MRDWVREKGCHLGLREIARVAYLGQITNIKSGRARKLYKVQSQDGQDINVRDWSREKGCRH